MSEKSWASLAPLLDHRRYVESIVAGVRIPAHPDFRFVTTMNEDASTYEIPEYIHSRLMPQIYVDFPEEDEPPVPIEPAQVAGAMGTRPRGRTHVAGRDGGAVDDDLGTAVDGGGDDGARSRPVRDGGRPGGARGVGPSTPGGARCFNQYTL